MNMTIDGIGLVTFKKSKRARNVCISVESDGAVRVAVPFWVSYRRAEEVLQSKRKWIKRQTRWRQQMKETHEELLRQCAQLDISTAKNALINRTRQLAADYGFDYSRITIRNQKTRWGSCSASNGISLNINLIHLPEWLQNYVIMHELMHTRVRDHHALFWAELSRFVSNAKALDRELRTYPLGLLHERTKH